MIFVILGTQDKEFTRLLKQVEKEIKKGNIKERVIVQAGSTKYKSEYMEILDYISMNEFKNYIKKSDYIITHGGVGTILDALLLNKKIIAVPRLSIYKEHENDHQVQIIEEFSNMGYIIDGSRLNKLDESIDKLNTFIPKSYKSNNKNMINLIENYIDNL